MRELKPDKARRPYQCPSGWYADAFSGPGGYRLWIWKMVPPRWLEHL